MNPLAVPGDVTNALAQAGYRAVSAAGPDGTGFLARPVDGTDAPVEVHVLATAPDDVLRARLLRLRAVRHEHLAQLLDAWEISPGRLAVVVEHVPGRSLAELRADRAPLSDGEAATVTIPAAQALAALHEAGLVHGGPSAGSVVVRPDGRPVLVDLRGTVTGVGDPDADLRRLLATVLAQMPDADAHLASREGDEPTLRDVFEALLRSPDVSANRIVDACFEAAEPEPVRIPDLGSRAAADLLRTAVRDASAQDGARTRQRRRRRRPSARVLGGAVAVLLGLGALGVAAHVWRADHPADRAVDQADEATAASQSTVTDALRDRDNPVAAAVELTRRRTAVVAAGSAARLGEAEQPGGPAHTVDSAFLDSLAGQHVEGLTVDVTDAALVPPAGAGADVEGEVVARVAVTAAMSAHTLVSADGGTRLAAGATPPRTVVLGLSWTADGWRVWDVDEAPAG